MALVKNKLHLLFLPFALCGFAVAQTVYNLLLQTPLFLVARQNSTLDVWVLTLSLSFVLPMALALPGWLSWRRWPAFSSFWCWIISGMFAALFLAQLLQQSLGAHWLAFLGIATATGVALAWVLLFTRWSLLTNVLPALAVIFPVWFLLFSPVLEQLEHFAAAPLERSDSAPALPDIVFVVLDELPLATLLDRHGGVDEALFPGFARLQSMSTWYADTISVSDGTVTAVPAILTGRYPDGNESALTVAAFPLNLFTALGHHYEYNVAEAVTRFCPQSLCPRIGPGHYRRIKALLLDLTAVYLHRVVPDRLQHSLPSVTNNWSGFFAERQVFFPEGWLQHAGAQTEIDRPGYFNRFTESISKSAGPVLNFMHILFPHEPNAYLPDGENYGLVWMRGQYQERWGGVEWGVISGKQRHYLQVQYADRLLNNLLDHLQERQMLQDSMIVVVADHGISFALNDTRRALSDINQAAMLKVPMFIKYPGQRAGQRSDRLAMTIDILPTILAALGFAVESLDSDGIDLASPEPAQLRQRRANSHLHPELKVLSEADLDIGGLVAENRAQLQLDDPDHALWGIGPHDKLRGQALETVCESAAASFRVNYDAFTPLPNTNPEDSLEAYVSGNFSGGDVGSESKPFLITSNGRIVASGNTWTWNATPQFFALVQPKYVNREDWQPKAWLLEGHQCLGAVD